MSTDADGQKKSIGQHGSVKVENKDGTSYEMKPQAAGGYSVHHDGPSADDKYDYTKTPDGKGGYVEHHTGQKPEDNYDVTRTPDGKYTLKDGAGEKTVDNFDKPQDPRVEKARTLDTAESKIKDHDQLNRFRDDMENFDGRARKQQISPEEQGKFYNSVSKLMEAGDNKDDKLSQATKDALPKEADRLKAAEEIMTHGAHPDRIDQGNHGTCGAAALESQMFTTHPGAAADMITKVATTGSYGDVHPNPSLIKPDEEAKKDAGVHDGDGSYASQLFRDTAISSIHPEYHRVTPNPGAKPPDSGDRFNQEDKDDNPGLTPSEIQKINQKISGDTNPLPIIENTTQNANDGQNHVKDQKELEQELSQLKGPPSKLPASSTLPTNLSSLTLTVGMQGAQAADTLSQSGTITPQLPTRTEKSSSLPVSTLAINGAETPITKMCLRRSCSRLLNSRRTTPKR